MGFWDKTNDFLKDQQNDIRAKQEKFDRLSDIQILDKFNKTTSLKEKVALKKIMQERGIEYFE